MNSGTADALAAARQDVAAFATDRDVVVVSGSDAATFLQGQLSADVAALTPGGSAWTLLLEPQGKVDAWGRVHRLEGDAFCLDVDAGWGELAEARLRRFLLRVDVELRTEPWRWVGLRGPRSDAVDTGGVGAVIVCPVDWRGLPGVDLLGPDVVVPVGVVHLSEDEVTALRVEQGWPALGRELDDTVIPAEAGEWLVERSASFTKGCYTGQELVARIDSRGSQTPRRLRGVVVADHLDDPDGVPVGSEVVHDGAVRGTLSSVSCSPLLGGILGMGLLHRSVEDGAEVEVRWAGGRVAGRVVGLPVDASVGASGGSGA